MGTMGFRALAAFSFGMLVVPAHSTSIVDALNGLTKTSFGRGSLLSIGDTVDVIDPSLPKERCIKYETTEIVADSNGAIFSDITYRFVRDLDQFENTFKYSYNVEASSSANLAKIVSGESTLKSFGSFENYLRRDRESALIIIEANALHGRDFIRQFELADEYKPLVAQSDFAAFRQKCGTHFVRGWNRKSAIKIIIEISNVSQEGKIALENTIGGSVGGSLSLADALGGSAKTTVSNTISDTLRLAEKIGKVSARAEAIGGAGIGSISAIATAGNLSDPQSVDKLLTAIVEAARTDFTYANSAPDEFIFVPFPQVDPNNIAFNAVNFDRLGEIYRALVRVDQRVALYADYRVRDNKLWDSYFRVPAEKTNLLRTELVKLYQACRNQGECEGDLPQSVDGLLLEDMLSNGHLSARCYFSNRHDDVINGQIVDTVKYLSSIAVVWKGKVGFLKSIDLDTGEAFQVTPAFEMQKLPFDPAANQSIAVSAEGDDGDAFLDLHRESVDPRAVIANGELSVDALRNIRKKVARSVFIMKYQTVNGYELDQSLGMPEMKDCPVTRPG